MKPKVKKRSSGVENRDVATKKKSKAPKKGLEEEKKELDWSEENENEPEVSDVSEISDEDDETMGADSFGKHKLNLQKLKETDPEFFKFLQEEDADLLNVADDDEGDDDEGDNEEEQEQLLDGEMSLDHNKPKAKQDSATGRLIVDARILDYLQKTIDIEEEEKVDPSAVRMAVDIFIACVARVGADIEAPKYVINEQRVFESAIRLCFQCMPTVLRKLLKPDEDEQKQTGKTKFSKKRLKKYQNILRAYLQAVMIFLGEVQTPVVTVSTLKAIITLIDFYAHFTKMSRQLIKSLTRIWSRKTLECRLIAFVCMIRLVKDHPQHFPLMYKNAYVSFVGNSKVVTNETWPLLQFMHRTYAELTLQCPDQAYRYAFVYIRQMAVHLRNAMIGKGRKGPMSLQLQLYPNSAVQDLVHSVYNWQMIQCMYMWVRVVAKTHTVTGVESIGELVYPLAQVIIGIFRLSNAPTFLPLRMHCCELLIQLQASCSVYIPVLHYAIEVFWVLRELTNELKKKPSYNKNITKIPEVECTLRISSQYSDLPQWRKAVSEQVFRMMMQAAHLLASQAAFPDVVVPVNHAISSLLGEMKNSDCAHLFRALQTKLKEHSVFVQNILKAREVRIDDEVQVLAVRFHLNDPDSPLRFYYRQWEKVWKTKQMALLEASTEPAKPEDQSKQLKRKSENANEKDVKPAKQQKFSKADKPQKEVSKKERRTKTKALPAAERADASIADKFADLTSWSDDDDVT